MYVPAHFEENRPEVLHQLISDQPFGTLVTTGPNGLDANHLPFEFAPAEGSHGRTWRGLTRSGRKWLRNRTRW
jgi:transcriptional regulator